MRSLLASTCLTSVAFILASGTAHAEQVIDEKITSPIATSTANDGSPDDIKITKDGSVILSDGIAVTIDSNNKVSNAGDIQVSDADDATGILAGAGLTGAITNSGEIIIDEDYEAEDEDEDGDVDGPFAEGSGRYGIRTAGEFTGNIVNSGAIGIAGNDSAGIALGGDLRGSLTNSGRIEVVGDRSVGIRAGDVTGNVRLNGQISVLGEEAVGVALDGDIGGALSVQGSIAATGYRAIQAPADASDLDEDDLLQGGPALRIAGNVAGGIIFDAKPADLDKDEDDEDGDGVDDVNEKTAAIASYGAAPAVQIGAAGRDIAIGAVAEAAHGHGLVIKGSVSGIGVYEGVDATGLVIGGLGGDVVVAGGMTVTGSVKAQSKDAVATAIRVGSGASMEEIRVSGSLVSSSGGKEDSVAQTVVIEEGASVARLYNDGKIEADAAEEGRAAAIVDRSGSLSLVENSGTISAGGPAAGSGRRIAIDLSTNDSGAIVRQTSVEQGVASPTLDGDILFGAGDDMLDVADGNVSATTRFGAGANRLTMTGDADYAGSAVFGVGADRMSLAGDSTFVGSADFGGGADGLQISGNALFEGAISGAAGLDVVVDGGTLTATNLGSVALSSLTVSGEGVLGVSIDADEGKNTLYDVAGAAAFGEGTEIRIELAGIGESEGRFVFVKAGALTGTEGIGLTDESLPFLFKGALESDEDLGEVAVVIERKEASDLGLNGSETRAYESIMDALDNDADVADVFLAVEDGNAFRSTFRQMLPDHAGGAFDTVTQGSRSIGRFLMDANAPVARRDGWSFWLQQVAWGSSKDLGDTAAYDISGWGASAGGEILAGDVGSFGLTLAYLSGKDEDGETDNAVRADQIELAGHWRGHWGGLRAHARASAATIDFEGTRRFTGLRAGDIVGREAVGNWDGRLYSAAAGASYEVGFGRFSLRPIAALDYYRLQEDGYVETGGGDALNLTVDDRDSDELAATASLALGVDFGSTAPEAPWLKAELEGGRRTIVGGALGATVARIGEGESFTLLPEDRVDGWLGRLRVSGGNEAFSFGGELSVEEQQDEAAIAVRATLRMGL